MAYVEPDKDKELDTGAPVATGPEAGGGTLGSGATGSGTGGTDAPAAAAEPKASSSSGPGNFVGINQYLEANKPQSQKLASDVGGYVGGLSQAVKDTLPQQTNLYNQAVDKNTVNLDQNLFNEAKTNTAAVAQDQQKAQSFKNMRDASYKGPSDFESSEFYKPTADAFAKAQQASQNTETEQGQRNLLNNYEQEKIGKVAGTGVNNFDQMLLQSGGGKEQLAKAREGFSGLKDVLDQAKQAGLQKAQQAQATTAATRNAILSNFGEGGEYGQKALENRLNTTAQQQQTSAAANVKRLQNAFATGQGLDDQDLKTLGISRDDYNGLLNTMQQTNNAAIGGGGAIGLVGDTNKADLSAYFQNVDPGSQINAQNVASADDYARYAALNELMGTNGNFLNQPGLAGTANMDTTNLNLKGAQDYLQKILQDQALANLGNLKMPAIDYGAIANNAAHPTGGGNAGNGSYGQNDVLAGAQTAATYGPFGTPRAVEQTASGVDKAARRIGL